MLLDEKQQELRNAVESLIDAGCNYRLDDLEKIYAPELNIVMLQPDGSILVFDYQQNMDFFRGLRDSGAPPIDTTAEFNHVDVVDRQGYVIVTRHMNLGDGPRKIVFNLMLKKPGESWRVYREHAIIMHGL